jgi:hypothetical protein
MAAHVRTVEVSGSDRRDLKRRGQGILLDPYPPGTAPRQLPTVAGLIAAIERFIDAWNDRCTPFTWNHGPDTVITKGLTHATARHERRPLRSTSDAGRPTAVGRAVP